MSVRSWLVDALNLPTEWDVIPEQSVPDVITRRPVVVLKHSRIEPRDEGSLGQLRHTVIMSVFSPYTKVADAEDDLDDAVTTLLTAIDSHDRINWSDAQKVVSPNEKNFGWDITLTVLTDPEPEEA